MFRRYAIIGFVALATLCAGFVALSTIDASAQVGPNCQGLCYQIHSGGYLNVETGGALQFNGVDKTTALAASVTTPVAGVAASYKIARGETALGGTNPTAVATGLTTIVACTVSLKLTTAPGLGTSVVTYGTSSGTMNMYGWKVTGSDDATLIASTGVETIGWVCVGT